MFDKKDFISAGQINRAIDVIESEYIGSEPSLPSDEDIEKEGEKRYGEITGGQYHAARPHDKSIFKKGAKWMREQIKSIQLYKEKPFLKVFLDWFLEWRKSQSLNPTFDKVLEAFKNSDEYKMFCERYEQQNKS